MSASGSTPMMQGMQTPMMANMGMMPQQGPMVNAASSQFYQANNMPMGMDMTMMSPQSNSSLNELEAKIAKLERSINRLDARINKLEGTTYYSKETYETDGNMYMV